MGIENGVVGLEERGNARQPCRRNELQGAQGGRGWGGPEKALTPSSPLPLLGTGGSQRNGQQRGGQGHREGAIEF